VVDFWLPCLWLPEGRIYKNRKYIDKLAIKSQDRVKRD
jgi:hypothetical protein